MVELEHLLIEALGIIYGAGETLTRLAGGVTTPIGEHFDAEAERIRKAAFGELPENDDEYDRDPIVVEMRARSYETAADAIAAQSSSGMLRDWAAQIRRERTVDVKVGSWYPEVVVKLNVDA